MKIKNPLLLLALASLALARSALATDLFYDTTSGWTSGLTGQDPFKTRNASLVLTLTGDVRVEYVITNQTGGGGWTVRLRNGGTVVASNANIGTQSSYGNALLYSTSFNDIPAGTYSLDIIRSTQQQSNGSPVLHYSILKLPDEPGNGAAGDVFADLVESAENEDNQGVLVAMLSSALDVADEFGLIGGVEDVRQELLAGLDQLRTELQAQIDNLHTHVSTLQAQVDGLQNQITALLDSQNGQAAVLAQLQSQLADALALLQTQQAQISAMQNQNELLGSRVAVLEAQGAGRNGSSGRDGASFGDRWYDYAIIGGVPAAISTGAYFLFQRNAGGKEPEEDSPARSSNRPGYGE
jgi:outer membrane murein-binding lipoprotein Lpp